MNQTAQTSKLLNVNTAKLNTQFRNFLKSLNYPVFLSIGTALNTATTTIRKEYNMINVFAEGICSEAALASKMPLLRRSLHE